ncbi:MAG: transporter [Candidatus Lloydbacteria bacterium RIFCSPHIGHO2_01_FULL_49_22]|uniref:Transporter n=1 Tax=Candidatus Lloydbacteria bacterium RIFCSPHIGHO2_01_FULL_49_22 TaxID=1798658 RepID=A0A1G2CZK8_9BACT|nr:MAG: transporter [Candidatus Lloydbacteria bacterium RIFCSPHIGHO2_01_FULL_49_22]OGZ09972.1 MAG: transporter [Candidatus Lloydbacteria bacterium RIFCSPHIGHO2_02_FULL_50_18]
MIKAFFGDKKWFWWAYGGLVFLLCSLYAQVHMTVLLNDWYGRFYDMMGDVSAHNLDQFWKELMNFFYIAIPYSILASITGYFTRHYGFAWREAITMSYLPKWRNVKIEIEGASQRIQEDASRFAKIVESLGLQVARAVMVLIAFLPVLWTLSSHIPLPYFGPVAGSLVWVALCTSLGGMTISWFVGYYLPKLQYNNDVVEARFRKELVYGEDDKQNHASIPTLLEMFTSVRLNYRRLFLHYGYFDLWSNLYGQIMVLVPFMIAGPNLFLPAGTTGLITLGVLMKVSNAFDKVHSSFSLFIDNWTTVTELRSIWRRLHEFERNIDKHQMT